MSKEQSVTRLIRLLKDGDELAIDQLWEQYFDRLVALARRKIDKQPRRVVDEEDVAVSVFKSLWHGAVRGHFPELTDRGDLWRLLLTITRQKVVDEIRRNNTLKRGSGNVSGESAFGGAGNVEGIVGFDHVTSDEPDPEFTALLDEQFSGLLDMLRDDTLRTVAVWRMEGYTNAEIAKKIGLGERSVERKLRLIRDKWSTEFKS